MKFSKNGFGPAALGPLELSMASVRLGVFFIILGAAVHTGVIAASPASPELVAECKPSGGLQFISDGKARKGSLAQPAESYRRTTITRTFMREYGYFLMRAKKKPAIEEDERRNVKDTGKIKAKFIESPFHLHYFYETEIGLAMLSRWDFSKEVAATCVPWDTMNFSINGNHGGLVLVSASEDPAQCQWDASLYTDNKTISYRLLIPTHCSNGKPAIDANAVVQALKSALF